MARRFNVKFVPRTVGFGAGLLALSLVVFGAAGAVWGMLRPRVEASLVEGSKVAFDGGGSEQFVSFVSFSAVTSVLAAALGMAVYYRAGTRRGLATLLWLGVVAAAGAAAFYVVGGYVAPSLGDFVDLLDESNLAEGTSLEFVPDMNPGVGWLCAPFMAMLAYWCAVFVGGAADEEHLDAPWARERLSYPA